MAVTPKDGWENTVPARSYERSVATIKFRSYGQTSSSLVSASQHRIVATIFASNVPTRSFSKSLL